MSVMRGQCDARPTSQLIGQYQIILLGDRGTCVLNNLPRVALDSGEAGNRTSNLMIASSES